MAFWFGVFGFVFVLGVFGFGLILVLRMFGIPDDLSSCLVFEWLATCCRSGVVALNVCVVINVLRCLFWMLAWLFGLFVSSLGWVLGFGCFGCLGLFLL